MSRQIAYLPYRRTFRTPLRTAHGEWTVREGFIVRIEENGQIGYGEVAPIPGFGSETLTAAEVFLKKLAQNPDLAIPAELPCCAFAVSSALVMSRDAHFQASAHPVAALLPAGNAALKALKNKSASGYSTFKWKIGVEPLNAELEIFQQLLTALPKQGQLRLDANAGLDEASLSSWLEAIGAARNQVEYVEQPLAVGQEPRMAELMAISGVPIALDESLNGQQGAQWMTNWTGPLVVKPALMGDIAELQSRLVTVVDRVVLSSVFETGVGLANALRLADQIGANKRAIGFDTFDTFEDTLQLAMSAPYLTSQQLCATQLDQLWQTLLHSK